MATPAKPRQSGIPGSGRLSSIPTPGRSRSNSNVHQDDMSRALADALKVNDPSFHRNLSLVNNAPMSSQSVSHPAASSRRSVVGRPPSATSSSVKSQERTRTPTSARTSSRPPSRQLELHKSSRTFVVGDNVRIESLGFEGMLRYMGEIDGKPGLWAGVELSGGFTGKGKNNGSVGGIQYFSCPDKCGVFVAATKLSPPTVGPGAPQRPSSVASSRGGRTTPATSSTSGRITPSLFSSSRTPSALFTNGRITPSSEGRATPLLPSGRSTPSSTSMQGPFKIPLNKSTSPSLSDKITVDSQVSRYTTTTAKHLSSTPQDQEAAKDESIFKSKGGFDFAASSPVCLPPSPHPVVSPFTTPKAGYNRQPSAGTTSPTLPSVRSRSSVNSARARIPSGVAMPPPPSPVFSNGKPLLPGNLQSHLLLERAPLTSLVSVSSRPTSSTSQRLESTGELSMLEQLQSRLEAAEYENERLRAAADSGSSASSSTLAEQSQIEIQDVFDRYSELQDKFTALEARLASQANDLDLLQTEKEKLQIDLSESALLQQQDLDLRRLVEERSGEIKLLQQRLDELERLNLQKDDQIASQSLKIEELLTNHQQSYLDFQEEKRELALQVDELRVAGQETIALYEERLSVANSQRYELEQRVLALEASLTLHTTTAGPDPSPSKPVSSATQIDNEALQEQIQHLQKKSAELEEQLEEARAVFERDVANYQEKISRYRLEDEQRRRDLAFKTKSVEELTKSEKYARNRVDEIEEALRESTVALENARGEVESLRAELANLEVLIDDASEGDISSKLANFAKRLSSDKSEYQREIKRLQQGLLDSRAENNLLHQRISERASQSNMQDTIDSLNKENQVLRSQIDELEGKLFLTSPTSASENQIDEVNFTRKQTSRDMSVPNGIFDPLKTMSTRPEPSTEEVAGLKHIVQELQKENLASTQLIKLLESENALLSAEAEQLRLEANSSEGSLFKDKGQDSDAGTSSLTQLSVEQRLHIEADLDQMRKRLGEAEMKHARIVHDLNKEISELETLVESKIYREDELEQEIEKLKDKLFRQKKASKTGNENIDNRRHLNSTSSNNVGAAELEKSEEVCEICERPGHDIFNCSLLKDDSARGKNMVVCEDCESPGHVAAECPHSSDVF